MASQRPPAPPALDDGEAKTIAAPAPQHALDAVRQISGDAPTLIAGLGSGGASSAPTMLMPPGGPAGTLPSADAQVPVSTAGEDLAQSRGAARYEPGPLLGAGGMGEVRLHVDRRVGRRIAKKTLHAGIDSEAARARFVREVRIQGQLEHPAVVPVYDLDVDAQGQTYFTMKRVRGETLEQVLLKLAEGDAEHARRFTTRRLLTAFAQVCLAVHYAHTRSVLHRDLKPGNIMLGDFGEVYVLDWGLAKVTGEASVELSVDEAPVSAPGAVVGVSGSLTVGGALFGTLAYMAPEQLLGRAVTPDLRADIYALGAILFEILTKTRLRRSADLTVVVRELNSGVVTAPSERAPDVPPELDALCVRALAVDPDERPESARALAEEVERYLDGDHDLRVRRELAAKHAASARRRIEEAPREAAGSAHVEALRESMKALALDTDQADAQRMLLSLLTDAPGEAPPDARKALEASIGHARSTAAKMGMNGLFAWLMMLPVAMLIGVRSWLAVGALALVTLAGGLLCRRMAKVDGFSNREALGLAVITAAIIALTSSYLGPFALMPTCAATIAIVFATATRRRERLPLAAILTAGSVLPYLAEISGLIQPAYAFEPGRIVVFARAVELPQWPTMAAMLYSTISFTVLPTVFVGRMRDALNSAEERNHLQAWYLRQLFPAAAAAPSAAGGPLQEKERSS